MEFLLDDEKSKLYLGLNNEEISDLIEGATLNPEDYPKIEIKTHFDHSLVLEGVTYSAPNYIGEIFIGKNTLEKIKELKIIPEGNVFDIDENSLKFEYVSGSILFYHI